MQRTVKRAITTIIGCGFILVLAAPAFNGLDVPFVGADKAWAGKGKGGGKDKGGDSPGKSGEAGKGIGKGSASASSSSSSSAKAKGRDPFGDLIDSVFGKSKKTASSSKSSSKAKGRDPFGDLIDSVFGGSKKSASTKTAAQKKSTQVTAVPAMRPQNTPQAVVRQYALANDMKMGELASALKSWNSLNRNMQAYLNNMDNPNSLPGLQIAYVRESLNTQTSLDSFIALGGDPTDPPTEEESAAAQDALAAQTLLDEEAATPGTYTQEELDAAQAVVDAYAGDDPQTVVDQYDAWGDYQTADVAADDAFAAASVSYNSSYDPETLDEVRSYVDDIIELKGLDTLVSDYDAEAAAEDDPTTETAVAE